MPRPTGVRMAGQDRKNVNILELQKKTDSGKGG